MAYIRREDQAAYVSLHYQANKEVYKNRASKFRKIAIIRNREYIREYLKSHPCVDCGNSDSRVLDFDHIKGEKENNISNGVNLAWSIEKLQFEIDKCEVRCANCHRIATFERRKLKEYQQDCEI